MANQHLHPGLESRLATLTERIVKLKLKTNVAKESERISAMGEVERLERRHKELEEQLDTLNAEGPGFRQSFKAEIEKRIDDVAATVEDFVIRLDRAAGSKGVGKD